MGMEEEGGAKGESTALPASSGTLTLPLVPLCPALGKWLPDD